MYQTPKKYRHHVLSFFRLVSIIFMYGSLALPVFALKDDNKAKMIITADSTIFNYKTGFTIFEGHVKVDQGTTHIAADRLTTKTNPGHKIIEAIAYGLQGLAHYWTLPKIGDTEVHAEAKIIKFYPSKSTVALEQNVTMTQGENSFQGQLILYNRNDQTVFVPASNKGQAILVYHPDKKSDT